MVMRAEYACYLILPESRQSLRFVPIRLAAPLLWIWMVMVNAVSSPAAPPPVGVGEYILTTWRTDDGLPENSINSLAQTSDGYLWLGTRNGVARFDGHQFTTYFPDDTLVSTFGYSRRMSTEGDTMWAVSNNGHILEQTRGRFKSCWQPLGDSPEEAHAFLGRIDGAPSFVLKSGAMLRLPVDGLPVISSWTNIDRATRTSQYAHDNSGTFWYVTKDHRIARLRSGQPEVLPLDSGLQGRALRTLCRNADGEICVGTEREVAVLRQGQFQTILSATNVSNLFPAQDGGLWIWDNSGLRRWNTNGMSKAIAWTEGTQVWGAVEDEAGNIWCGTFGTGLWRITPAGEYLRFTMKDGLPGDLVLALVRDDEGNIWAGMDGGLTRVRRRFIEMSEGAGSVQNRMMTTVCPDRNGGMWAGTYGGGLFHRENGAWRRYPVPGFSTNMFVYAVWTDSQKRTWVGTRAGGGLICIKDGAASRPFPDAPAETSTKALWEDSKQRLWLGSDGGFAYLEPDATRPVQLTTTMDARAFTETKDGAIWIGTDGDGLFRWHNGKLDHFRQTNGLPGNSIWSLLADEDGGLWIGTPNRGLAYWREGKGVAITAADGLPDNTVCHLLEDRAGNIWGSTFHGVFRVSKSDLRTRVKNGSGRLPCINYGREDGLRAEQCRGAMQPAGMMSEDGKIWFPTMDGLACISPERIEKGGLPLNSFINGFTVRGETRPDGAAAPAGSSQFAISFTAPCLSTAERVLFRYRLAGRHDEWTEIGTRREVIFDTLRPGGYRFEVSARNPGGTWSGQSASLAFSVLPYFWQRTSFQWLVVAVGCTFLALVVRWISLRGMRRQLALAAQQAAVERERARISRDMHDELGSRLTRLSILSELAGRNLAQPEAARTHLETLSEAARETAESLGELIWTVKPANDTLDNLANHLCQCADEFFRESDIRCRFDIPDQLPPLPATADVRQEVSLAIKEALNNVARHSEATEVRLGMQVVPQGFIVTVGDNGRGLDPQRPVRADGGNGLPNMNRRLARIGGKCEVESPPGGGTVVRFTVPIRAIQ
jgi:ligand-binding sensor domain-containing protein/signal transduction histidine kinase